MKFVKKKAALAGAAVVTAAAAFAVTLTMSSAHALNRVGVGCVESGDIYNFLQVRKYGKNFRDLREILCFANAGAERVDIYGADAFWTGNNRVTVNYQRRPGEPVRSDTVDKYRWGCFGPCGSIPGASRNIYRITEIRIW